MTTASDVGLTSAVAQALAREHGPNAITQRGGPAWWSTLFNQFRGAMFWLLLVACAISALAGERADAIAIAAIVMVNAIIGFFQEHRAERAMAALRALSAPRARVRRDGVIRAIAAIEIVPGDVLVLEAGDRVAADAELLDANALSTNEAALTGESMPIDKRVGADEGDVPLAERAGSIFMGTSVATGTGLAHVTAIGMQTELGRIAGLLSEARTERTPLEIRLEKVGRSLGALCIAIAVAIAAIELARGEPWIVVLMTSVSLAVAAVPEGLAAIVTIALAIGVQRMAARNVLVRKLPAVETLGSTTLICTDKTGTLTTGVMSVREIWGTEHRRVLDVATAASNAELADSGGTGDPTELAILAAARERGIEREEIERTRARVLELPFDATRKRMSILRADGVLYVKGAVDLMLSLCIEGTTGATEANRDMASRGLRVLAVAIGHGEQERELALVGLIGLADPPRTEAIEAIRIARGAGIRTVMITGDHPITAQAIAREMGIVRKDEETEALVHARATPEDKLRIVRQWKERGEVVAMTGDGVNDAPALQEAHIGIAMGKSGTDVAREASDMVLTDDDYASIVAAVREGRGIFDNIRKTLVYLLAGNFAELTVMVGAIAIDLPLPLTALQILWINLVTDGLPAIALVMDPPDSNVLAHAPRRMSESILGPREWRRIVFTGIIEAVVALGVFAWAFEHRDLNQARTLVFSVLVFSEALRAFAARSEEHVFFETGVFTNLRLLAVILVTVLVQLTIVRMTELHPLFGIGPISLADGGLALTLGLVPVTVIECGKLVRRTVTR